MKISKLAILFMLSILLPGCWDNTDLTDINIMWIDKDEWKNCVTVQVRTCSRAVNIINPWGWRSAQIKPVYVKSYKVKLFLMH